MRSGGVLLPVFSLPSPYGVGTMGAEARRFVDFLKAAGQRYWQILPICPTSYGDSPYQTFSSFAGNPYFIDLEELTQDGYLEREDYQDIDWEDGDGKVHYDVLYKKRYPVLRKAFERFVHDPPADFTDFVEENPWLEDYALFMALKDAEGGRSWQKWPEKLRRREPSALGEAKTKYVRDIAFWECVQYLFFRQWRELKRYANDRGVYIIGDLPIYVSGDSADVWAHPEQFQLDGDLKPVEVAGCPPDAFTADGQLWGNPLFDWDTMKADGFSWWVVQEASTHRV